MHTEGEGLKYSGEQGDAKRGRHYPKTVQNRKNYPELIHKIIVHKVNKLSVVSKNQL